MHINVQCILHVVSVCVYMRVCIWVCACERDRECEWVPGVLPCLHTESVLLTDGRGRAVTVTELELSEREIGRGYIYVYRWREDLRRGVHCARKEEES